MDSLIQLQEWLTDNYMTAGTILSDLTDYGYTQIPISLELEGLIYRQLKSFYSLPVSEKVKCLASSETGVLGYYPSSQEALSIENELGIKVETLTGSRTRGYSSFDFLHYGCSELNNSPLFMETKQVYHNDQFKTGLFKLHQKVASRCHWIAQILFEQFNTEYVYDLSCLNQSVCLARLLEYKGGNGTIPSKAHTDYELFSFIVSTTDGLQIKKNDTWTSIKRKTNHAIILAGDMAEALSCGKIKSVLHRVACSDEVRHSFIYFQGPHNDFRFRYPNSNRSGDSTYLQHISSMLLQGAPQLESKRDIIAANLGLKLLESNPFKHDK
jgi:isopenicillin N synthase-like dioxygenase